MDGTYETKIREVRPRVVMENDNPRRICELKLNFEFGDDVAAGLGEAGQSARRFLCDGTQKSATLLLDAMKLVGTFEAGEHDKHKIELVGIRATASKPKKEDTLPQLTMTLAFATRQEDQWWFTQHLEESMKVRFSSKQTQLKGV